jgi:hypothetical protein
MKRIAMVTAGALVFVFAGCMVGVNGDDPVGEDQAAVKNCGDSCPPPTGVGSSSSSSSGRGTSSSSSSTSSSSGSPPPSPMLPQGLTGGLSYLWQNCSVSLSSIVGEVTSGVGFFGACISGAVPGCIAAGGGFVVATANVLAGSCGPSAIVIAGKVDGVSTLTLGSQLQLGAAPGWAVGYDGDYGATYGFGFHHQELTAGAGGIVDGTKSTLFALPPGTACGFHHTLNSPANSLGSGTCMGFDPAQGVCPGGWAAREHFDMSSGNGYYVWCEYLDVNNLCPNGSVCEQTAVNAGYAIGLESNTGDVNGTDVYGTSCPAGTSRSAWYDAGRSAGQGLSACVH